MLNRGLILLILAMTQFGCSIEEGVGPYRATPLSDEARHELERDKRDLLKLEDIKAFHAFTSVVDMDLYCAKHYWNKENSNDTK